MVFWLPKKQGASALFSCIITDKNKKVHNSLCETLTFMSKKLK